MEISEDLLQLRQAGLDFEAAHQKRNWPSNFVSPIFWPNCNCLIFLGFSPKITPFHFCVSRNRVSKIYFALKTVKNNKIDRFSVQNSKNEFKQIEQTNTINRSVLLIYRSILSIYQFFIFSNFFKNLVFFTENRSSDETRPDWFC
jgi:hypothetical protein